MSRLSALALAVLLLAGCGGDTRPATALAGAAPARPALGSAARTGEVVQWDEQAGSGMIRTDGTGESVPVRRAVVSGETTDGRVIEGISLREGLRVRFRTMDEPDGRREAVAVQIFLP